MLIRRVELVEECINIVLQYFYDLVHAKMAKMLLNLLKLCN